MSTTTTPERTELLKKAKKLEIVVDENKFTDEDLQTAIANCEAGPVKNFYSLEDPDLNIEAKSEVFQTCRILREGSTKNGNKLKTEFSIVDVKRKRVLISQKEAAAINEGRREDNNNKVFELLLRPGTKTVEPLIQTINN